MIDTSARRARLVAALQIDEQALNTLVSGLDASLGLTTTDAQGNTNTPICGPPWRARPA
jgi:hypothetical protein